MFLNELSDKEKIIFLNLANIAIMVDDEATKTEDDLLKDQIKECGISDFTPKFFNLEILLNQLDSASRVVKKVIFIELLAVFYADDILHDKEIEMMKIIGERFDFSKENILEIQEWFTGMKEQIEKGREIINS